MLWKWLFHSRSNSQIFYYAISLARKEVRCSSCNSHLALVESHSQRHELHSTPSTGSLKQVPAVRLLVATRAGTANTGATWVGHWHLPLCTCWFLTGFSPLWLSVVPLILTSLTVPECTSSLHPEELAPFLCSMSFIMVCISKGFYEYKENTCWRLKYKVLFIFSNENNTTKNPQIFKSSTVFSTKSTSINLNSRLFLRL